ncbi:MAG: NADH ubiquinone oxidoreductase chain A, partial [uncultured Acidimicrobiales bacterium]
VRVSPPVPDRRHLRRRRGAHGRGDARHGKPVAAHPPTARQVHQLRERRGPGRQRLVAEPDPVLRVRPALCDVRRGSGLHLPVGRPARGACRFRARRDGHLRRHPRPRPALRVAQGRSSLGL